MNPGYDVCGHCPWCDRGTCAHGPEEHVEMFDGSHECPVCLMRDLTWPIPC